MIEKFRSTSLALATIPILGQSPRSLFEISLKDDYCIEIELRMLAPCACSVFSFNSALRRRILSCGLVVSGV
jgi:hypothetical protein